MVDYYIILVFGESLVRFSMASGTYSLFDIYESDEESSNEIEISRRKESDQDAGVSGLEDTDDDCLSDLDKEAEDVEKIKVLMKSYDSLPKTAKIPDSTDAIIRDSRQGVPLKSLESLKTISGVEEMMSFFVSKDCQQISSYDNGSNFEKALSKNTKEAKFLKKLVEDGISSEVIQAYLCFVMKKKNKTKFILLMNNTVAPRRFSTSSTDKVYILFCSVQEYEAYYDEIYAALNSKQVSNIRNMKIYFYNVLYSIRFFPRRYLQIYQFK